MATDKGEINPALLKGLTFRTAETRDVPGEGGQKEKRSFPIERPLKVSDVLAVQDAGTEVVIVAADGQKHRVSKAAVAKTSDKSDGSDKSDASKEKPKDKDKEDEKGKGK